MADIEVFPDRDKLTQAAAGHVIRLASESVAERGTFTLGLSGGSTPQPLYATLARKMFAGTRVVNWPGVHLFWGDERCVPPDDPRSNYRMVRETLIDLVPLPPGNVHRIHGEEVPESAAAAYERELKAFFGIRTSNGMPAVGLDLILLGMGKDGHTASLFPGLTAVDDRIRWVMALYVEVASMWRITLTPAVINAARNIIFIVSGSEKARRLSDVLEGPFQPEALPAQAIRPAQGRLLWLLDEAAASCLKKA